MPTIPGQRPQSMLGGTMADLQPIGSTLLTACNLLMSLAGPERAGVGANRRVCPLWLLWCRAAFPLWKSPALVYFHCCCCTCLPAGNAWRNQSLATVNFSLASRRILSTEGGQGARGLWQVQRLKRLQRERRHEIIFNELMGCFWVYLQRCLCNRLSSVC